MSAGGAPSAPSRDEHAGEPFRRSPLIDVGCCVIGDDGTVSEGGLSVTAVGIPVMEGPDGLEVALGVPPTVVVGNREVAIEASFDTDGAARRGFQAKVGQTMALGGVGGAPLVVFVGCGPPDDVHADTLRRAAAALARGGGRSGTALFVLPASLVARLDRTREGASHRAVQAVAEAAVLATYRFVSHKSRDDTGVLDRFLVGGVGIDRDALDEGVRRGAAMADAVCWARDLVNEPPSSMTPARLADTARTQLSARRVTVDVWDEDRIAAERLGGLLGVARGSAEAPRLVRADYEPSAPVEVGGGVPHVVLVGKGITFDSGGLSLKTADGMVTMKTDMSGAAAVLAAASACGELGVRVRVTAIAPMTENMPGGRATKPGDVLTARNGRTIEVLNTDAEGRLVLADALSLAAELRPDAVIDLATLTGACVVALGGGIAGVFGSDDELIGRVRAASDRAGEATWELPLPDDYRSHIDSEVADMKNVGKGGQAGAIAAALLLSRFVEGVPWVHLDIAGPARSDEDSGVLTKGATGFGVRTLLELLSGYGSAS